MTPQPTPRRWTRWLSGCLVLTALGLIVLGSQLEPVSAKADGAAAASNAASGGAAAAPPSYLPSGEGVNANNMARYEAKRAEDKGDIMGRLLSLLGIPILIGIAWLMSSNRRAVSWRMVLSGTLLQAGFALFILWTPIGKQLFSFLNDVVTRLLDFTTAGTAFLVGPLLNQFTVAFNVLPTIIFFSALMTVLYHLGIMQAIVRGLSAVMQRAMGTSGAETLSATANIFVGQTEAPLVVKPYVSTMTRSELMVVMVGGFATVAGGVLAAYVGMLRADFPDIAGHLIAASVMSAPAALVIAKVMIPEEGKPVTLGVTKLPKDAESDDANVIDAAARGAGEGLKLAVNVGAMLLAFIALIALVNFMIGLPSYINNRGQLRNVQGYLLSATLPAAPGCEDPKSDADIIACTHKSLLVIADARQLKLPEGRDIDKLSGKSYRAEEDLQKVEELGVLVKVAVGSDHPLTIARASHDCSTTHRVAACGALLAVTQADTWTPSLASPDLWPSITLELILGWLFFPIAFIMGVPLSDCQLIGQLLGQKIVLNEFIAYLNLGGLMQEGVLRYRSIVIATYALCGFANFGSIAIQIGGISGIAPNRRHDLAKLGFRAMIGGTLAAFMTATIAGALIM
jgi:nucleoside transporter